jgi:hypothetical protein
MGLVEELGQLNNTEVASIRRSRKTLRQTSPVRRFEAYMDTPYYERMQYIGDTRIQSYRSCHRRGLLERNTG